MRYVGSKLKKLEKRCFNHLKGVNTKYKGLPIQKTIRSGLIRIFEILQTT